MMFKVTEAICSEFLNKTVCMGLIPTIGDIIMGSLYNKLFSPSHVCQSFFMCPKTSYKETIKEYVQEVLKDKPKTNIPTPTKKSTYNILHLSDPHIDLQYQIVLSYF